MDHRRRAEYRRVDHAIEPRRIAPDVREQGVFLHRVRIVDGE
jgi:hypothetical protein